MLLSTFFVSKYFESKLSESEEAIVVEPLPLPFPGPDSRGAYDGSKLQEAAWMFIQLCKAGAKVSAFSPNISQDQVTSHVPKKQMKEKRWLLCFQQ